MVGKEGGREAGFAPRPMRAGEMLDTAADLYRRGLFRQWFVAVVFGGASVAAPAGLLLGAYYKFLPFVSKGVDNAIMGEFFATLGSLAVGLFLFALLQNLAGAGAAVVARQTALAEKKTLLETFFEILAQFPRVLAATAGLSLVYVPFFAAAAFVFYKVFGLSVVYSAVTDPANLPVGKLLAGAAVGYALWALVHSLVCVAIPAAVFEKKRFFGAAARSVRLCAGKGFARVFGVNLLWNLFVYGASFAVWFILRRFFGLFAGSGLFFLFHSVGWETLEAAVPLVLFAPLASVFPAVVFWGQRARKEGADLALRLQKCREMNDKTRGVNDGSLGFAPGEDMYGAIITEKRAP